MNKLDFLQIFKDHFKDILYLGGAIISFLAGRRLREATGKKGEADAQGSELENVEVALKIYRVMLTDLQDKLKKAEEAYTVIEKRLHQSIENNKSLYEENKKLKIRIHELTSNNY